VGTLPYPDGREMMSELARNISTRLQTYSGRIQMEIRGTVDRMLEVGNEPVTVRNVNEIVFEAVARAVTNVFVGEVFSANIYHVAEENKTLKML
jgi:hypothetical protein